jgi:SPW repeat
MAHKECGGCKRLGIPPGCHPSANCRDDTAQRTSVTKNMKIATWSRPKDWEDWSTVVIGLWLFASPWILQVDDPDAAENFLLVGALVLTFELITFHTLRAWEEWINIALGAWLIVSSFATSGSAAIANAVICGVLLLALSLYERWEDRRQRASR